MVEETKGTFIDRVAVSALAVHPGKLFLTLLALPFYAIGWLLGMLWVVVMFAVGAVKVGIGDARRRLTVTPASRVGDR